MIIADTGVSHVLCFCIEFVLQLVVRHYFSDCYVLLMQ